MTVLKDTAWVGPNWLAASNRYIRRADDVWRTRCLRRVIDAFRYFVHVAVVGSKHARWAMARGKSECLRLAIANWQYGKVNAQLQRANSAYIRALLRVWQRHAAKCASARLLVLEVGGVGSAKTKRGWIALRQCVISWRTEVQTGRRVMMEAAHAFLSKQVRLRMLLYLNLYVWISLFIDNSNYFL